MLRHLHIRNYALIEHLDADLGNGLTVITGETGAGKSILLGALGLVLGKRADSKVLFDPERKCVVEARFDLSPYGLEAFFAEHDLDFERESILRREINVSGKSRAFINDTPVKLKVLDALAGRLVHIHSQHETLDLNRSRFQLGVLDALAGHAKLLSAYGEAYAEWTHERDALQQRRAEQEKALAERDYWQFQFDELQAADLDGVDAGSWEAELRGLEHAEEVKRGLMETAGLLTGEGMEEAGATQRLAAAASALRGIAKWMPDAEGMLERMSSLRMEAEALAEDLERLERNTDLDPERQEFLESRLDQVNRLLLKHRLQDTGQLRQLRDEFDGKLQAVDAAGGDLDDLEKRVAEGEKQVRKLAAELHKGRSGAAPILEQSVQKLLAEVGMPHARLKAELEEAEAPGPTGISRLRFVFASNKGSRFEDLRQVASGGELSRLMLCIKRLVAAKTAMPTLLFDEIDAGVGGEIGKRIGHMLAELGQAHQVLAITHLPQIAAAGRQHLFVYKDHSGDATRSHLRSLEGQDRVEAIAHMLSGDDPGKAALHNATELLAEHGFANKESANGGIGAAGAFTSKKAAQAKKGTAKGSGKGPQKKRGKPQEA